MVGKDPRGQVVIVSGPSGVGKSTVLKALFAECPDCMFSTSATTRAPRPAELDGVHYFFYSREHFTELIDAGEFLEWAEFCGNLYGTPRSPVITGINNGHNVILDIEAHGASEVLQKLPGAVSIFILPPSLEELERRICTRGTESESVVMARLQSAREQLAAIGIYDYLVVNDSVSAAVAQIKAIIQAESCRVSRFNISHILRGVGRVGEHD